MAIAFFDNLPPELRNKIYEYALDFEDTPLRHATQLQPFMRKLTGFDYDLPFALSDQPSRGTSLAWTTCDLPLPERMISTGIRSTSKLIYSEAIKVFYEQNVIIVDIDLLKLPKITSPAASDLSLATRIIISSNEASHAAKWLPYEKIKVSSLLPRARSIFPPVRNLVLNVEGTRFPANNLFDMAEDCHRLRRYGKLQRAEFEGIGCFVATAGSGLKLTVVDKPLADLYEEFATMSDAELLQATQIATFVQPKTLRESALITYTTHGRYKQGNVNMTTPGAALARYSHALGQSCPIQARRGPDSLEFWTHMARNYDPSCSVNKYV